MSGLISNDNLVTLLVTLCLWLCLRMLARGPSWPSAVLLGLVFGAAMLAKQNGPLIVAPIGATFLVSGRKSWHYGVGVLVVAGLVSGWWFIRNAILYDDPLALRAQYVLMPALVPSDGHVPFDVMGERWIQTYQMIWARFGLGNHVPIPTSMGIVYDLMTAAGIIGVTITIGNALKQPGIVAQMPIRLRQLVVLAVFAAAWALGLSLFIFTNIYGTQGRYLLPGVAAWASALSLGIHWWVSERHRLRLTAIVFALMSALAIIALSIYHAAYQPLPLPPRVEVPRHFVYDQTIELLGVDQESIEAYRGDTVEFTLYWKVLKPTTRNIRLDIHTYGGRAIEIATYPGSGNLPSTQWVAGQTWAEHYRIEVFPGPSRKTPLNLLVFLIDIDSDTARLLPITGPDNAPIVFPAIMNLVIRTQSR